MNQFSDSNRPPADANDDAELSMLRAKLEKAQAEIERFAPNGIGNIESSEPGSAARYNAGKPMMSLVPLRFVADSMKSERHHPAMRLPAYLCALYCAAEFQESGDPRHIKDGIRELIEFWPACAKVFEFGRKKCAPWNWAKGMAWSVPLDCIGRHALKIRQQELLDSESGQVHEAHILCNLVMLALYVETFPQGNDLPDRKLFQKQAVSQNPYDALVRQFASVEYRECEPVAPGNSEGPPP